LNVKVRPLKNASRYSGIQVQGRRSRYSGINHRNTWSILRIKLKLHCVENVESDTEIGQKKAFCKGLKVERF
jgi:hypothetical protein